MNSEYDFRLPRFLVSERDRMFDERSIATDDEIRKSPVHQELFAKNDIFGVIGANMSVDNALGWFGVTSSKA